MAESTEIAQSILETIVDTILPLDKYEPVQMTFMQRKLLRLQQENLASFGGQSINSCAQLKMSKLEKDK